MEEIGTYISGLGDMVLGALGSTPREDLTGWAGQWKLPGRESAWAKS